MTPNPKHFKDDPAYLRALLERAQIAQAEMAKRIGIEARTFRRYVLGESAYLYPVQFAVECVVAEIEAAKITPSEARDKPAVTLARDRNALTETLGTLPVASMAYRRTSGQLKLIQRELKRRNGA
jgi:transcriptional regulator with XRE-family HTH domain